jgi:hypothetical protein
MRELSKDETLKCFEEINRRLALDGKHGEILIMGGAALTLVFNARDSTRDIDAIFRPIEDMRKIIDSMADDYDLPHDWLNDKVKVYVTDNIRFEAFLSYSNLKISAIDAESLLAMKLSSARFVSKDMEDSIFLMNLLGIRTEKELSDILDKYINPFLRNVRVKNFTREAFEKYQEALLHKQVTASKLQKPQRKPSLKNWLNQAKTETKTCDKQSTENRIVRTKRDTPDL